MTIAMHMAGQTRRVGFGAGKMLGEQRNLYIFTVSVDRGEGCHERVKAKKLWSLAVRPSGTGLGGRRRRSAGQPRAAEGRVRGMRARRERDEDGRLRGGRRVQMERGFEEKKRRRGKKGRKGLREWIAP